MVKFNDFDHVFKPIKVGNLVLKNRIQFAPMVSSLSTSTGAVSEDLRAFIEMQAKTGVSVITIGATPVDHINAVDYFGAIDATSDDNIVDLLRLSEAAHRYGALLSVELVHAGRGAPRRFRTDDAIAPSPIPVEGGDTHIREMNYADFERVKNTYCDVVERLHTADFDMVQIHAAHGNLFAQFLSPLYNKRTDHYGGSFENRCRYPLEVLRAIRERVGNKIAIDMRISGDELIEGGMHIEETVEFIKLAQQYIDSVHVSQGLIVEPRLMPYTMPAVYLPHCHNVKWSAAVKACPDIHIPVTVVGSITRIEEAEEIIASGKADMVAMCRQLMADPNTIHNAWRGHTEKTRPCLRCHQCAPARICHMRCATNPILGREAELGEIHPARTPKRAVVVGGGLAGCMAAKTLVYRGHEVILLEKGDELGGMLHDISKLDFKGDMRAHLDWLIRSTKECGADIRLGVEADVETVLALEPDVVYVATGAKPLIFPIPGIDRDYVKGVIEVDSGRASTGQNVVVCGAGLSGLESALQLAMEGKQVTVVERKPLPEFAIDASPAPRLMLLELLEKHGVKLIGDSNVAAFTEGGVEIEDRNWNHTVLPCDTAVIAMGMKSDTTLYDALREEIPDVYAIGDCRRVGTIMRANHSAFDLALLA